MEGGREGGREEDVMLGVYRDAGTEGLDFMECCGSWGGLAGWRR